jgi:hypothetical protein
MRTCDPPPHALTCGVPAKQPAEPPPPLVTTEDVVSELRRLFDAGPESGLVIRVYGDEDGGADDTFREMLASLKMYDERFRSDGRILVQAPSHEVLVRAMSVLGREQFQRRILSHVLTTFGRRLIDPLGEMLDATPDGSLMARLGMLRDFFLAQIADLKLTPESQQILSDDLRKLLSNDYLAMVAENEERVQRPRVAKLAQEVLRLIGGTFHRAFARWPEHAEHIATSISRRLSGDLSLRDVPAQLREQITDGIEEFLWVETSTEIEGALRSLFAEQGGASIGPPPKLEREAYREFAGACWKIIADNC